MSSHVGGNDRNAVVFNKDTEQVMAILKGHTKKVTSVIYHPSEVRSRQDELKYTISVNGYCIFIHVIM